LSKRKKKACDVSFALSAGSQFIVPIWDGLFIIFMSRKIASPANCVFTTQLTREAAEIAGQKQKRSR
jgi:hypothetical protein